MLEIAATDGQRGDELFQMERQSEQSVRMAMESHTDKSLVKLQVVAASRCGALDKNQHALSFDPAYITRVAVCGYQDCGVSILEYANSRSVSR